MATIIERGETFRRTLKFSRKNTGESIDLTGCTAHSEMRNKPKGTLLATATCTIGSGIVEALFDKTATAGLPLGEAGYDIWLVCGDDQKPVFTERVSVIDPYTDLS